MAIVKDLERDGWNHPIADGSETDSFWIDATGGWDALTLPDGVECKAILIQVHSGLTDFTQADSPDMFYHSSNSDGTGWTWHVGDLSISIAKADGNLGYIKTQVGKKIAVKVLS